MPLNNKKGFTLIEVLIALTIIAIALGAIIKTVSDQAANASHLKQKTIGQWVALNAYNQLLIDNSFPGIGKDVDSSKMAGHEWHIQRVVEKTPSPDSRKVIYRVFNDSELEQQVSYLVGYVTDPRFLTEAETVKK